MIKQVVLWMPRVRAAIPKCAEPFTAYDVCRVLGLDPNAGSVRWSVFSALCTLAENRELEKRVVKRGEKKARAEFTRTVTFKAEESDPETQRFAAEFLQGLTLSWGSARVARFNRDHAAAK